MRKRLAITAGAATLVVAMAIPMLATGATGITARMDGDQIVNPQGGDPTEPRSSRFASTASSNGSVSSSSIRTSTS